VSEDIKNKVETFFSAYPSQQAAKGRVMVQAGDDPPGVIFLTKGHVHQYDIASNGEQIVVNVFKPPAFFPMSWAINKTPNQYFFEATSDIEYHLTPAEDAVQFLRDNHDVAFDLLARVYSGTDGLLRRMAHLMGGSARTRLLFELRLQALRFGQPTKDGAVILTMNERDLAMRAGLTRETVSRELSTLRIL
jgi:CRP-like cAMP-binding protein